MTAHHVGSPARREDRAKDGSAVVDLEMGDGDLKVSYNHSKRLNQGFMIYSLIIYGTWFTLIIYLTCWVAYLLEGSLVLWLFYLLLTYLVIHFALA